MKFTTLTRAEMQVMSILWDSGRMCDVHDVVAKYNEPRPAYTTVATFLKILTTKGFVAFKKGDGKQHLYYPLISKAEYTARVMNDVKDNLFDGSASSLVSFFVEKEQLTREEIEDLIRLMRADVNNNQ